MRLDKSILVHASPEQVYAWLSPSRMPRWDAGLLRLAARDDGPMTAGGRFEAVRHAWGHRFEMEAEATALDPGRRFAWRQTRGDFEAHQGMYELEAVPEGTLVHLMADVEFPYVLPRLVTEDEVRRVLSGEADEALFNLKELAESGG